MTAPESEVIVGIDLGTTNSLVAYSDERGPQILDDGSGPLLPSVVDLDVAKGGHVIGTEARRHVVERPLSTIYSVKRLMGRGMGELAHELPHLAYRVVQQPSTEAGRDLAVVEVDGRRYSPPEISAMILAELKRRAERVLRRAVHKAVITVPAYFDDAQRQATRDAGLIAGLEVVRLVNEPTAASLAYGLDRKKSGRIAVYDLGGGTFDVSILNVQDGLFEVLSTHGDTHLGGDDFDRQIIELARREIRQQFNIEVESPATKQALRNFAEQLKIALSSEPRKSMEIDLGQGRVYRRIIERNEFEAMIEPFFERTLASCRHALRAAKLKVDQIDEVVLVGGSTRIPYVRRRIEEFFGRKPYTALNPDHVVALGAAVQASILSGARSDTLLLDVIPLSLGIETLGGAMGKLITANVRIPCHATETFTTFQDGQTAVKINVLQGERELAADCRSLGVFELRGVPPMPAGIPKINVTFLIDQNGILNVSAREQRSGVEAGIQIVPAHGLTREEVERMRQESFAHAREDLKAHRLIDLRNQVTFDTTKTEQMLARYGHLLPNDERDRLLRAITELRALAEQTRDNDLLHKRLHDFGQSTLHLAELGMREALKDASANA